MRKFHLILIHNHQPRLVNGKDVNEKASTNVYLYKYQKNGNSTCLMTNMDLNFISNDILAITHEG